ncbi:hypothetical protein [Pseudomonas sp. SDO55104_S430]
MQKNKEHYFQDRFMGVPIKCDSSYPSLRKILEALYVLVYETTKMFSRPRGYHVRVRFTEKMTSRTFSARLATFYKRKSGYIPFRLTVEEYDGEGDGLHHHFCLILDDRQDRRASIERLMSDLFSGGFLENYKVICPDRDAYGHHIRTLEDKDSYFTWMTYLAKVATKADIGQVWSSCRATSRSLKEWKLAGKPDLRNQLFGQLRKDNSANVDVLAVMQLVDVPSAVMMPQAPLGVSCRAF